MEEYRLFRKDIQEVWSGLINFFVNEELESREIHLRTDKELTKSLWIVHLYDIH